METNPLDAVEEIILTQEWPCQRLGPEELTCEVSGRWCEYQLHFVWQENERVLQFFLLMDMRVPPKSEAQVYELLSLLNNQLSLGNFEIFPGESTPAFRHGLLLPGTRTVSDQLLVDMIEIALSTCEKFYPAFQFVIWGGKSAKEAATMALIDTHGEA